MIDGWIDSDGDEMVGSGLDGIDEENKSWAVSVRTKMMMHTSHGW